MANYIKVRTEWLDGCSGDLQSIASAIQTAQSTLSGIHLTRAEGRDLNVSLALTLKLAGTSHTGASVMGDIQALSGAAKSLSNRVNRLSAGARAAARQFEKAEKDADQLLISLAPGQNTGIYDKGGSSAQGVFSISFPDSYDRSLIRYLGYPSDPASWSKEMRDKYDDLVKEGALTVDAEGRTIFRKGDTLVVTERDGTVLVSDRSLREDEVKVYREDGSYYTTKSEVPLKREHDIDALKYKHPELNPKLDKDGKPIGYGGPSFDSRFETGIERSASISMLHQEEKYERGPFSGTTTADVLKFSTTAGLYGGLYDIKRTEDGKQVKTFSPGIRAEMGASFSALEVNHKGRFGNQTAGVDYGFSTKEGAASAKVDAEFGIVNKRPAAHVGASAEVIGGEVGAEVGVDVAGMKVKAKGTLNYGLGAHADVGIHDGKISADIGITFGFGASMKLEFDYGDMVDNAVSGMKKLYKNAHSTVKAFQGQCRSFLKRFL